MHHSDAKKSKKKSGEGAQLPDPFPIGDGDTLSPNLIPSLGACGASILAPSALDLDPKRKSMIRQWYL